MCSPTLGLNLPSQCAISNCGRDGNKLATFCVNVKDDGVSRAHAQSGEDALERVGGHSDLVTAPMFVPAVSKERRAPDIILRGALVDKRVAMPSLPPITDGWPRAINSAVRAFSLSVKAGLPSKPAMHKPRISLSPSSILSGVVALHIRHAIVIRRV